MEKYSQTTLQTAGIVICSCKVFDGYLKYGRKGGGSLNRITNKDGLTEQEFLKQYEPGDYERPSVTVDMLVFAVNESLDGLRLLLIRRKNHPFIHCWALPGGFVEIEESLEEAARRELKEETGLQNIYMEQLYTFGDPERDPRTRIISTAYLALIQENAVDVKAGDDAAEACWFTIREQEETVMLKGDNGEELWFSVIKTRLFTGGVSMVQETAVKQENSGLAFDHEKAILMGLQRLRNKAEYTNILFGLMPEEFTLPELQKLYETVLGKQLYKANFRKKISAYVEATGTKKNQEGTKRSPELYRFRKEGY